MKDCKCAHCALWVDCNVKGFCLAMDLFTYTEKEEDAFCESYVPGKPLTDEEYELAQLPI